MDVELSTYAETCYHFVQKMHQYSSGEQQSKKIKWYLTSL